jgi:hypothetical protein
MKLDGIALQVQGKFTEHSRLLSELAKSIKKILKLRIPDELERRGRDEETIMVINGMVFKTSGGRLLRS